MRNTHSQTQIISLELNFCAENDPCSSRPCQNGGACTKTSGTTFTCECANGYSGKTCAKGKRKLM